jgi:hypothetical protein
MAGRSVIRRAITCRCALVVLRVVAVQQGEFALLDHPLRVVVTHDHT